MRYNPKIQLGRLTNVTVNSKKIIEATREGRIVMEVQLDAIKLPCDHYYDNR